MESGARVEEGDGAKLASKVYPCGELYRACGGECPIPLSQPGHQRGVVAPHGYANASDGEGKFGVAHLITQCPELKAQG